MEGATSEAGRDGIEQRVDLSWDAELGPHRERRASMSLDRLDRLFRCGLVGAIVHSEVGAVGREALADCPADPS
jgi:hypothetical protein